MRSLVTKVIRLQQLALFRTLLPAALCAARALARIESDRFRNRSLVPAFARGSILVGEAGL